MPFFHQRIFWKLQSLGLWVEEGRFAAGDHGRKGSGDTPPILTPTLQHLPRAFSLVALFSIHSGGLWPGSLLDVLLWSLTSYSPTAPM